jgi:circadian clock protein KaiC
MSRLSDRLEYWLRLRREGVIALERLTADFAQRVAVCRCKSCVALTSWPAIVTSTIRMGGFEIYPQLIAAGTHVESTCERTPSSVAALNALLGGGPLCGSSTLVTGPTGSGDTTIAFQYLDTAYRRRENCTVYEFDERISTLLARAEAFGLKLQQHLDAGFLVFQRIAPAERSPG